MKMKRMMAVLLAGLLGTSCSSAPNAEPTTQEAAPALLQALVDNAGNDDQAQAAWKALLQNSVDAMDGQFRLETSGEDYLYDENQAQTMVTENFIYMVAKEAVFDKEGDNALVLDLTDVNDSYNTFVTGYGTIDQYGSSPALSAVLLSDTVKDSLKGSILSTSTESNLSIEEAGVNLLMDAIMDFGYIRNVTPITNASLYTFDLKKEGDVWKLDLAVKDKEEFIKAASNAALIIDNRTNSPVLVLDAIESETFTFTFDSKGVLDKEENNIYHVINAISDEYKATYMNILNRAEFTKAGSGNVKPAAFTDYFKAIQDGSLKEDEDFTISDWN